MNTRTPLIAVTLLAGLFGKSIGSATGREYHPNPTYGGGKQPFRGHKDSRNRKRKNPFRGMTYSAHHCVRSHI